MSHLTAYHIRNNFIDFFKKNNHQHINSSPLVPSNDPTLMFTNAGMVQFKDMFTGIEEREYKRAVTSQKCVRAGGKHNDLENVGYTARHHTFFEMLGNFSFGDYFKEEAIYFAWQMLVKEYQIPADKLYITVYHEDQEAFDLWQKITGFQEERIIKIKTDDNFWSMGDSGPCGPCSEIFYDHGEKIFGSLPGTKDQDGDRFVEIWNLVFMQYEQKLDGSRILLPKRSVDTGMGLERITAVMQNVHNNYDTDIFRELIADAESIIKVPAEDEALISYRVIADHLRSCAFLIADGVMPSNEGRGYVLRRIMRRSMRHINQLGAKEPVMYKLLPQLIDLFGHTYPELIRAQSLISNVLLQEEEKFRITLDKGLKLLHAEAKNIPKGGQMSGETAFKLYDTYGFPLDLTEDILKKQQIKVDLDEFNAQMNLQKERARKLWSGTSDAKNDSIWFDILSKYGPTEFLGYSLESAEAKVVALLQDNREYKEIAQVGAEFILITHQTPFYGESGGQIGDIGIAFSNNCKIIIKDTLRYLGKIIAHICTLEEGSVKLDEVLSLNIDQRHRDNLRIHHTATHILHAVLRKILGEHVTQKGSLVLPNKLRFDFSHPKSLSASEIYQIEKEVNRIITHNSDVTTEIMHYEDASKKGAMALFGEKYENEVRVVTLGQGDCSEFSMELCGGTHVTRTGNIGIFKIINEIGIAAGIRRIEAICGEFAFEEFVACDKLLEELSTKFKVTRGEIINKIDNLTEQNKQLIAQLENIQLSQLTFSTAYFQEHKENISGIDLLYKFVDLDIDPKIFRVACDNITKKIPNLLLVYSFIYQGKLSLSIAISKNLIEKINAQAIVKELIEKIGGQGGGQAHLAQLNNIPMDQKDNIKLNIISIIDKYS
ncbi:MAG: alanine--tRNA ligase [Rickettsiaceae bacterium]|nr:alanine--tRNA ligase [Rickettsiaceae bacterium]